MLFAVEAFRRQTLRSAKLPKEGDQDEGGGLSASQSHARVVVVEQLDIETGRVLKVFRSQQAEVVKGRGSTVRMAGCQSAAAGRGKVRTAQMALLFWSNH